jgi:hypothetical protein
MPMAPKAPRKSPIFLSFSKPAAGPPRVRRPHCGHGKALCFIYDTSVTQAAAERRVAAQFAPIRPDSIVTLPNCHNWRRPKNGGAVSLIATAKVGVLYYMSGLPGLVPGIHVVTGLAGCRTSTLSAAAPDVIVLDLH